MKTIEGLIADFDTQFQDWADVPTFSLTSSPEFKWIGNSLYASRHTVTLADFDKPSGFVRLEIAFSNGLNSGVETKNCYIERMASGDYKAYWLAKLGPGRPVGSVKESGRKKTHGITIEEDAWEKAQATGNASQYIEGLIQRDRRK